MTDQEKNEVLAKWRGFTTEVVQAPNANPPIGSCRATLADYPIDAPCNPQRYTPVIRWFYPDGRQMVGYPPYANQPPDFLHSLDAQAKWLYPKIYEVKLHQRSNIMNGQWCAEVFLHTPSGCTYRDTPAEAFVDALLYVIKEERSNG